MGSPAGSIGPRRITTSRLVDERRTGCAARIDTGATGFSRAAGVDCRARRQRRRTRRSRSRPTRTCSSSRWPGPGSRCIRSTRVRSRVTGNGTGRPAASPTQATPRCWPTSCAPTDTCTARCRDQRARAARSRRSPASIRKRSGRCTRPSAACVRCCWSSIRKRCRRFRTSSTRPRSPSSPRCRPRPRGEADPPPLVALLQRAAAQRPHPRRADPHRPGTPALRQPARVEAALGATVSGLVGVIAAMQSAVDSSRPGWHASSTPTRKRRSCAPRLGSARSSRPACWPK